MNLLVEELKNLYTVLHIQLLVLHGIPDPLELNTAGGDLDSGHEFSPHCCSDLELLGNQIPGFNVEGLRSLNDECW